MTDEELNIPPIAPVAGDQPRPRWSVMIPTYNAAATIGETLTSVIAHGPAADDAQVMVIDNASTDATLDIVRQLVASAADRVAIHVQPQNLGLIANWNACIELARGELVHILHADDYVRPGFYQAVEAAYQQRPDAELCLVRVMVVDAQGGLERITDRVSRTDVVTVASLAYENHFYPPGVVVRRAGYERVGGFSPVLEYVPDWEMWLRLLTKVNGVFVNEPLACYRVSPDGASSRVSRTGGDLRELQQYSGLLAARVPGFSRDRWREMVKRHAYWSMIHWRAAGDEAASQIHCAVWRSLASPGEKLDAALAAANAAGRPTERPQWTAVRLRKR